MKIESSQLKKAIPVLKTIAPRKSTFRALESLLIRRHNGVTRITANDLDRQLTYTVPGSVAPATSELGRRIQTSAWERENDTFLVPMDTIEEAAKKAIGEIEFVHTVTQHEKESDDDETEYVQHHTVAMHYECKGGVVVDREVSTLDHNDYVETLMTLSCDMRWQPFTEASKKRFVQFCEAASTDETRYVLNGVYIENGTYTSGWGDSKETHSGHDPVIVATDGRRLAYSYSDVPVLEESIIFPLTKAITNRTFQSKPWRIGYAPPVEGKGKNAEPIQKELVAVTSGDFMFVTKLLEGNYPNFRQIMLEDHEFKIIGKFDPKALLEGIRALPKIEGNALDTLVMELRPESIHVSRDEAHFEIPFFRSRSKEEIGTVRLSAKFVETPLKWGLDTFCYANHDRPARFQNDDAEYIIMPMRAPNE
jgi:DNA polymerase III sliding clamp (beta) subunit (PCNA family)